MRALPQIRRRRLWSGRRCPPRRRSRPSLSLRARVCHPNTRRHVRLLGPCFKTGRSTPLCQHPERAGALGSSVPPPPHPTRGYNTLRRVPRSPRPCTATETDADPSTGKYAERTNARLTPEADATGVERFPFSNFTYCFTLFPKCFSSFPHGTCSLSVSRLYLALDGIYHPF